MTRTTLDIDEAVLQELRRLGRRQGKSLGQLVSELLASALAREREEAPAPLHWTTKPMRARVNLEDEEAMRRALEGG